MRLNSCACDFFFSPLNEKWHGRNKKFLVVIWATALNLPCTGLYICLVSLDPAPPSIFQMLSISSYRMDISQNRGFACRVASHSRLQSPPTYCKLPDSPGTVPTLFLNVCKMGSHICNKHLLPCSCSPNVFWRRDLFGDNLVMWNNLLSHLTTVVLS